MADTKQKPMLFGNVSFDAAALDDIEKFEDEGFDWSYVPGYSEQRRMNEHAVRRHQKPIPIDKLYWARASRTDGSNVDYREAVTVTRLGYRACTVDDLKERGWGMPPAAHVAADGSIRREDTVLAIVGNARAEKNKQRQMQINAEFEGRDIAPEEKAGYIDNVYSKLEESGKGTLQDAFRNMPRK